MIFSRLSPPRVLPWLAAAALCTLLAPSHQLFSNGGTFDTSTVRATGQLAAQRQERIQLVEETLNVRFLPGDPEHAEVSVEYSLVNHGGAERVTYGFPVDGFEGGLNGEKDLVGYRIEESRAGAAGGTPIAVTKIITEPRPPEPGGLTEGLYGAPVRQWFISELAFARGEAKTLRVNYRVKSQGTTSGTSKSFLWKESPRTFAYTFRPAQTWAAGRVGRLHVAVDVRALRGAGAKIQGIEPGGSVEREGVLRWEFADFDLKSAPDLVLTYDDSASLRHAELAGGWLPRADVRSVRASSTHAPAPVSKTAYGADNLLDGNAQTAWVAASSGPAVGQWIEVRFARGTWIKAVGLLNGYLKDAGLFAASGRIKKLRVESETAGGEKRREEIELPARAFGTFEAGRPEGFCDWVLDQGDSSQELTRVRLTILEAEPGTRFADTAASELLIVGRRDVAGIKGAKLPR